MQNRTRKTHSSRTPRPAGPPCAPRPILLLASLAAAGMMLHTLPACKARPDTDAGSGVATQRIAAPAPLPEPLAMLDSHPVAFVQYPSISPDGRAIVFSYAGDLWTVSSCGGVAKRLTVHPADELRSAFSPCGTMLAFESDRDGPRNIYLMPIAQVAGAGSERTAPSHAPVTGGAVRRITISDRAQTLGTFAPDSRSVYFASSHEPSIHRTTRLYRAPIDGPPGGGGPTERLTDAWGGGPSAIWTSAANSADGSQGGSFLFHRGRYDTTRPVYEGSAASHLYRFDPSDDGANGGIAGTFTQITAHPRHDGDGYALPDGSIVFNSSRDGQNNLWMLPAGKTDEDNAARQLTFFRPQERKNGEAAEATIGHGVRDLHVAPGGWHATFAVWDTLYVMDLREADSVPRPPTPVPIVAGGDASLLDFQRMNLSRQVSEAVLSPDGKTLATVARGEIFIRSTDKDRPTRRVTDTPARERDLAWSPDGRTLYFASDATGRYGVYAATVVLAREDLTDEPLPDRAEGAVAAEPEPEPEPDPAVPPATPAMPVEPPEPGAPAPGPVDPPDARGFGAADWSPFGETDPWHADEPPVDPPAEPPASDPPAAEPATPPPSPDAADEKPADEKKDDAKKSDEKEKKVDHAKRWSESLTFAITPLVVTEEDNRRPIPSPDGRRMLLTRGLGDLVLVELDFPADANDTTPPGIASERIIVPAWLETDPIWAPDSRHIIYEVNDVNFNSDIWLLDALDPEAQPINLSRHPDNDIAPRLSADGKILVFLSDRDADRNFSYDVYMINLDRKLDGLRPYEMADYLKESSDKTKRRKPIATITSKKEEAKTGKDAAPSPENPLTFDADDAWRRIRKVTSIPTSVRNLEITPAGDRIIFTASIDGSTQLLSVDYDGRNRRTVHSGAASVQGVSFTGDKVLFITGGQATTSSPTGGSNDTLSIDARATIDIAAQQRQKFLEAARTMGARFYHPTIKGLDWDALTERYLELAIQTRTDTEFNRVFYHMLGELDASHMGISGGRNTSGSGESFGYLGVDVEIVPGGYQISRIIPDGPADRRTSRLHPGEVIIAVDSVALADGPDKRPHTDLRVAMQGTSGQETLLELRSAANPTTRHVLITPYSFGGDNNARYEDEVARNRDMVEEISDGRLGYLHIRGMNLPAVRDFERDLFAAADGKLGLIIDVRDNGGGSTADILLSSLTAPRHAYTAARGVDLDTMPKDAYPRDRRLIYGYSRPINVLMNQYSYSNAEIFSHAIKTTGRGPLIGVPTFGAVISTGSFTLIDDTRVRMPFRGWYLLCGTDMENNGAEPDIYIPQTPEDESDSSTGLGRGRDRQLEAAVEELTSRLVDPITWRPLEEADEPTARR